MPVIGFILVFASVIFYQKFVISYILKFFENWIKRICEKSLLVLAAIDEFIKALKISRNKFKSIFKFK